MASSQTHKRGLKAENLGEKRTKKVGFGEQGQRKREGHI